MKPEYFYQKNEFVFAETNGHKPFPARVTKVNLDLGIYTVSFIGYKCTSEILAASMEKFDDYTINKYVQLYQGSKDKEERTILKKIETAKKEYDRTIMKNHKKKTGKGSKKSSENGQKGEQLYSKRLQSEMAQTKTTPDQFEQRRDSQGVKSELNEDNSSSNFNFLSNLQQKPTIERCPYVIDSHPVQNYLVKQQAVQEQALKEYQIKREIEQNLAKLSPIRSNPDPLLQSISQGIRSQSSSTPELLTAQTVSSASSLHFPLYPNKPKKDRMIKQPIEVIKEQNEISRNTNKQANHPIYDRQYTNVSSVSFSSSDGELGKTLNACEEVSIYEIDCNIDELQLQQTDYWGMLEYMTYRKKKLFILSYEQIIGHLIKILDILLAELAKAREQRGVRMLMMKKKQYLIAILSLSVPLKYFLNGNCLNKMIQFVSQFEASLPTVKSMFVIENFNIRSRLNILYQKFIRTDAAQLSLSQQVYEQIQRKFEQYKVMKFVY